MKANAHRFYAHVKVNEICLRELMALWTERLSGWQEPS